MQKEQYWSHFDNLQTEDIYLQKQDLTKREETSCHNYEINEFLPKASEHFVQGDIK